MRFEQDPRFTFDTFVVGPGNRMAAAAARRAAESPGTSYNPLFVYGGPGSGKTHLLSAVGALAGAVRPGIRVVYLAADTLVDRLSAAVAAGEVDAFRDSLLDADVVLLDDAHRLAGKSRTQDELLGLWEELLRGGAQVVLAADRPPVEIPALDEALRARMAGGLTVDVGQPEHEARVEIVRRGAASRGVELSEGADLALARAPLAGGHALHGGLERLAAAQSAEGRALSADEVSSLLAPEEDAGAPADEFGAFLSDIAATVEQLVEAAPWRRRLAEAILRYEGEGIRTRRLEAALDADSAPDVEALLTAFAADLERLREAGRQLIELDPTHAQSAVLRDPDRVAEAEAMLVSARAAAERRAAAEPAAAPVDRWYFNREKVDWGWLALDDRLVEELA